MSGVPGCSFCAGDQREPQTLTETKHFSLLADRNPLRDGHLLIVPREHLPSLGALPAAWDAELSGLKSEAEDFIREKHGPTIAYERGEALNRHAHLHILPADAPLALLSDQQTHSAAGLADLHAWYESRGPYLFLQDGERSTLADAARMPAGGFHELIRETDQGSRLMNGETAARVMRPEWARYRQRFGDTVAEVVACFLWREGQVCLLKRSLKLDSAPGRWHIVAGYLPRGADPLEHALTEVAEETGLESTQVRLMSRGAALNIGDPYLGTGWRIHPFLFEVLEGEPRLNWEHDELTWVAPAAIGAYGTMHWLSPVYFSLEATARR